MDELYNTARVYIHGVGIDRLDMEDSQARLAGTLSRKSDGTPLAVFTPNAEIIFRCSGDRRLNSLINAGDLNIPDGVGTVWAAKKLGSRLGGRVPGIELGERMLASCAAAGHSVFLLGGAPCVAEVAAAKLTARYPGLVVCGVHDGYFDMTGEENTAVLRHISSCAPKLLIVCMGFPRQEEWIIQNRDSLPGVRVIMALGGSADVWSGKVRRAPVLFRVTGLEWLWRISHDAAHRSRAVSLVSFVRLTLREKRRSGRRFPGFLS